MAYGQNVHSCDPLIMTSVGGHSHIKVTCDYHDVKNLFVDKLLTESYLKGKLNLLFKKL